jgi:hypothetical protein
MSNIRSRDEDFLKRMDSVWVMIFAVASPIGLSPIASQLLFGNYSARLLAIFVVLLTGLVLPFVVEISAVVSASARRRFLSWVMLMTSMLVMTADYVADAFLMRGVAPSLTGIPSGLIIWYTVRYSAGRLSRYFQANLRSKSYRAQIAAFTSTWGLKRDVLTILFFYLFVGVVVGILFQL